MVCGHSVLTGAALCAGRKCTARPRASLLRVLKNKLETRVLLCAVHALTRPAGHPAPPQTAACLHAEGEGAGCWAVGQANIARMPAGRPPICAFAGLTRAEELCDPPDRL